MSVSHTRHKKTTFSLFQTQPSMSSLVKLASTSFVFKKPFKKNVTLHNAFSEGQQFVQLPSLRDHLQGLQSSWQCRAILLNDFVKSLGVAGPDAAPLTDGCKVAKIALATTD